MKSKTKALEHARKTVGKVLGKKGRDEKMNRVMAQ